MTGRLDPPLAPLRGQTLRVIAVCRISTDHQDARSLDDQEALLRGYVARHHGGPAEFRVIASRDSGQHLDRDELVLLNQLIEAQAHDLVITEDLARICRKHDVFGVCGRAEDSGTRLIAINDFVDTASADWKSKVTMAAYRHETYCDDTARRIQRSLRNRFAQGGVVQAFPYGYIKPPGATSDADVRKDPDAVPIYDEWFRRLEGGATYAEVADWLNSLGIRPGPSCRAATWDVGRVRVATLNTVLKGDRVRNRQVTKRNNKTGRARKVPAPPEDLLVRRVPHLAFIEPARYDRVVGLIRRRNQKFKARGLDARRGVPRKRTAFPGQHLACGVCGRTCHFGGHGQSDHLICTGAKEYRCWNGVTAEAGRATRAIARAVLADLDGLPEFDDELLDEVRLQAERAGAERHGLAERLRNEAGAVDRQLGNVTSAIAEHGPSPALREKLAELEARRDRIADELADLGRPGAAPKELPSMSAVRDLAAEALDALLAGSAEAGRLARRLLPRLEMVPYRACDGGAIVPRAHLTFDLAALIPDAEALRGRLGSLRRDLVVDLFDPPQYVANRERVVAMRRGGLTEREVAAGLGLTVTIAQKAAKLDRLMARLGLDDAYVRLTGPPDDLKRMGRHRHPRYRFETLEGWTPDAVDAPRAG